VFIIAVALAALLAFLAPETWDEGDGAVSVWYQGNEVALETVAVGSGEAVAVTGGIGDVIVRLQLPEGIPVDERVSGTVEVLRAGTAIRPTLGDVSIDLYLPDGRVEPIPILRWDVGTRSLEAARRPPVDAAVVMGLLGLVIILWVSEAIPLFATSLVIPVVVVVAGAGGATDALAPFFHPVIALFFGGFLMAEAMRRVGLDHLAAVSIVAWAGRSPLMLFMTLIAVAAGLSMFMSNTAAVAVLLPIALAVTTPLGHAGYRKAAVLAIAYAATIGGVGSAIGTPANPLAIEFLDSFVGREISFAGWFAFGLPMVVLFLPLMAAWVWWRSGVDVSSARFEESQQIAARQLASVSGLTRDQWIVLLVFISVMAAWLTQTWHGVSTGIIAVAGAVALMVLGKLGAQDLQRISWPSLLTFGGGLALGFFLVDSGTSDWVAARLGGLGNVPTLLGIAVVAVVALGLTTVASNTAAAAMLIPLAIPLSGIIGVDPVLMVVVVAIASSVDFALVIGTPPTMMAYSTKLFTTREIFGTGIVLDLLGIVVLVTGVIGFWSMIGLV
jgi:sodium-dependent dicarboxylate transporter 2/3/5